MLDLWEYVGRLVTDQLVCNSYLNTQFQNHYAVNGVPQYHPNINDADYDAMRGLFFAAQGGAPQRPVSLMALGEMLWALTDARFPPAVRQLFTDTQNAAAANNIALAGRTPDFYTGLGATTIDPQLRAPGPLDTAGFVNLKGADRTDVLTLANAVDPSMDAFCNSSPWQKDCSARAIQWGGHLHPVAFHQ